MRPLTDLAASILVREMVDQAKMRQPREDQQPLNAAAIRRRLLQWYAKNRRDLPWRRTQDPYRIWISEIMLQQTRVAAVIPYYERFLALFPDVTALASAPEQQLLAAWAGLGYYSRARNLQKAARAIAELNAFPANYEALRALPGIGDYTASAIASIAFAQPHPAVDGNVLRVLSRLLCDPGNIKSQIVRERLRAQAEMLIQRKRPGDFNQAMMELGATICLPKQPRCTECPIRLHCRAHERSMHNQLPITGLRPAAARHDRHVLVIDEADRLLLWQRPADSKRLAGFWELPEREQIPSAQVEEVAARFRHTIVNTTYLVHVFRASIGSRPNGFEWLRKEALASYPLSTTARKALAAVSAV